MAERLQDALARRYGAAEAEGAPGDDALTGDREALLRQLARHTVRSFRPDPVPKPLLQTLLACAQSAPSKSDLQQYSVIVVEETGLRQEIAALLPTMPWVGEAPLFLVWCADMRRNQRLCAAAERPHANDNLDTFFNATVDAALAMGAFIGAAESAGLGVCPISYVRNHLPRVTELLAIPPGVSPVAGLCVGWPAAGGRVSMRLPQAVVVHRDRYDDGDLEAQVRAYDARRFEREPIPPEKRKNADVYGRETGGTWSDQVTRQLSRPERADFAAFLRRHGFSLD